MKKITLLIIHLIVLFLTSVITFAQVGINTTDPKGILDINSTTLGVVYPNVNLIATDDPSPVVNPQGGSIVEGTVVYNTNTTDTNPLTDVDPGIYVWDGSKWIIHFKKRQSEIFNQTGFLRTEANLATNWQDIPGLGVSDTRSITALYSGLYRIEVKTNFGAGRTFRNNSIFSSLASGQFRFLFGTTPAKTFETQAYSAYSTYVNGGKYFDAVSKETYQTYYVNLVAGTTYPFSLSFDAYDAPGFVGNGSTVPDAIVNLIDENFNSPYTVIQEHTPDTDCPTNGWVVTTAANQCNSCVGNTLNINANVGTNNCSQNATALLTFTPTANTININFDYRFNQRNSFSDSFRVYLHDGTARVGAYLVQHINTNANTSHSSSRAVTPGRTYTLRFEYINTNRGNYASVDNVVISEISPGDVGRGYIGNDVNCQIEFTYIGE